MAVFIGEPSFCPAAPQSRAYADEAISWRVIAE